MKASSIKIGRYWKRSPIVDVAAFLLLMAGLTWITGTGTSKLGYNWQWYRVPQYLFTYEDGRWLAGPLIDGLMVTFEITGASLILAFSFGLISALCRLSDSYLARMIARGYLELIRNTPLLVQLFFIYFVMAPIFDLSRFASAVLALSLFEGANGQRFSGRYRFHSQRPVGGRTKPWSQHF
jgi:polar amino acid transport system permease protein